MPDKEISRAQYVTGWNDTAHGILTWTDSPKWNDALDWALDMRAIATEQRGKAKEPHNRAYFDGVRDCVERYRLYGTVNRLES